MSKREDEEVDAFGRTVVSKGRRFNDTNDVNTNRDPKFHDNRNHFPVADRRPDERRNDFPNNKDFGNRDFHNNVKQLRPNLDYRDDRKQDWGSRDRSPPRNGNRPYGNFDDQQGGSNQNRRFNNKDRSQSPPRYNDGSRHAPIPNQQSPLAALPATNRILPIMSFKSFMQTQHDDLAPEVFQRKYEEYHLHYLGDFSKAFFRASMAEEWFQDRYNPVLIQELEKEAVSWAAKESAELKSLLVESPSEAVQGMSLDPPVKRAYVKPAAPVSAPPVLSLKETVEEGDATASTSMAVVADDHHKESIVAAGSNRACGRHFSGHENRTIYLSGIHACCTKAVLKGAINDAIANSARIPSPQTHGEADAHVAVDGVVIPAPERIVIAQPVWSKLFLEKFERSAWVIMPTAVAARQAVAVLKELVVDVPGPVDPLSGDKRTLFSFTLSAAFHIPKQTHVVPETMSHPLRVKADTQRALTLAALLDDDRAVPAESTLATILEDPAVQAALVKPTDQLDVSIAYLRRVHFLALYGGKRYRDESHLLANAASVVYRSKPCVLLPTPPSHAPRPEGEDHSPEEDVGMTVTVSEDGETVPVSDDADSAAAAAASEGSVGSKRKFEGEGEEQGGDVADGGESKPVAVEAGEEKDDEATAASTAATQKAHSVTSFSSQAKGQNVPVNDRRIESLISDLRAKRNTASSNAHADVKVPLTADEADAEVLLAKQEKAYMLCVETTCKVEKEGKARCCYSFCKKLFKDLDFLSKHLRSKHDDFALDALHAQAEPYMLQRFEAEDISARPLPPVEVESHGTIELKSVKEILDKYLVAQQQQAGGARDNFRGNNNRGDNHHNQGRFDHRGGDRQNDRRHDNHGNNDHHQQSSGRRGNDDRDRRATIGGSRPAAAERQYVEPRQEDNFSRRISSYLDVDAPKESAVSIDYGVALLPPVKRRKLLVKRDAPAAAGLTPSAAAPEMAVDSA